MVPPKATDLPQHFTCGKQNQPMTENTSCSVTLPIHEGRGVQLEDDGAFTRWGIMAGVQVVEEDP